MENIINGLFGMTQDLWFSALSNLALGGMQNVAAGVHFGLIAAIWGSIIFVGLSIGYSAFRWVNSKPWFFYDEDDSDDCLALYAIGMPIIGSIAVIVFGGFLGMVFSILIWVFGSVMMNIVVIGSVLGVLLLMWALRWIISMKKAMLVHTMDKGVHTDNGTPLEKTGLDRNYTAEEIEEAKRVLESIT